MNLIERLPRAHRLAARWFGDGCERMGWRTALVGGAVRDALIGDRTPRDLDFVVQGCASNDALATFLAQAHGVVTRTGLGGCRYVETEGVKVDAWCLTETQLTEVDTVEQLVAADQRTCGFTLDADCGAIVMSTGHLVDGGVGQVVASGVFDLSRARRMPPAHLTLVRSAALIDRYGWQVGPRLWRWLGHRTARNWHEAAGYAAGTGRPHLTNARIAELLGLEPPKE